MPCETRRLATCAFQTKKKTSGGNPRKKKKRRYASGLLLSRRSWRQRPPPPNRSLKAKKKTRYTRDLCDSKTPPTSKQQGGRGRRKKDRKAQGGGGGQNTRCGKRRRACSPTPKQLVFVVSSKTRTTDTIRHTLTNAGASRRLKDAEKVPQEEKKGERSAMGRGWGGDRENKKTRKKKTKRNGATEMPWSGPLYCVCFSENAESSISQVYPKNPSQLRALTFPPFFPQRKNPSKI